MVEKVHGETLGAIKQTITKIPKKGVPFRMRMTYPFTTGRERRVKGDGGGWRRGVSVRITVKVNNNGKLVSLSDLEKFPGGNPSKEQQSLSDSKSSPKKTHG